ncbi:FimV/HubP family polar landmark protein [Castellaniella defragrans]|uniref:FimV/HubP family polar landmark protein n=1 Tax=Castellaniella defragrans TaxID=75697 RepID=UPI002AFEBA4B|nr:FimV/HubP family polar landmark protein [Castellaniella defragrans]
MKKGPHAAPSAGRVHAALPARIRFAAGALALAFLTGGAAQAATFGHARLASGAGEPLLILVPVSGLTDADVQALSARPAPAADWAQAGLTPPVPLDSLSVSVGADVRPDGRRVLRIGSGQAFDGTLADLLLDVRTATGAQRYQVSLVAPGPARAAAPAAAAAPAGQGGASATAVGAAPHTSTRRVPAGAIAVRRGDTMFAISRRHAVDGVTIYQLMMALQRANPQAFIHGNVNLVRAGASLAVPDINDMLSISDAEARRQFQVQAAAFARMRARQAGTAAAAGAGQASAGAVSQDESRAQAEPAASAGDRLRLSEAGRGGADAAADARAARGHALKDAESRVGQLESNVQNLNQALQAQGEAARSAVAQGAAAIGQSIQEVASAISEASQEAAAQADEAVSAGGEAGASGAPGASGTPGAAGTKGAPGAKGASGAAAAAGASGASGAPAASKASGGSNASGASNAPGASGSSGRPVRQALRARRLDLQAWRGLRARRVPPGLRVRQALKALRRFQALQEPRAPGLARPRPGPRPPPAPRGPAPWLAAEPLPPAVRLLRAPVRTAPGQRVRRSRCAWIPGRRIVREHGGRLGHRLRCGGFRLHSRSRHRHGRRGIRRIGAQPGRPGGRAAALRARPAPGLVAAGPPAGRDDGPARPDRAHHRLAAAPGQRRPGRGRRHPPGDRIHGARADPGHRPESRTGRIAPAAVLAGRGRGALPAFRPLRRPVRTPETEPRWDASRSA